MLDDPAARWTYVFTKAAVFVIAAGLTWPLARIVGPTAWWGLAVFGLALAAMAAIVFLIAGRGPGKAPSEEAQAGPTPEPDPEDPVRLPVEDSLDLHSFPPADIPDVVADYLEAAHRAGFREVRLIHGRGIGVQRERVRSLLGRHPLVASFHDAPPAGGGWGATVAYLLEESKVES